MQGRLVSPEGGLIQFFPRKRWDAEFALAAQAGFTLLEWLYDVWGEDDNPIVEDDGIRAMAALSSQHGVSVRSLCAHYFVERPFVKSRGDDLARLVRKLEWLLARCRPAGIRHVVVPFLDSGAIRTDAEERCALDVLRGVLPVANQNGVAVHLECSLAPAAYARFLEKLAAPEIRITYDTGNSASFGYPVAEELAAYGASIGSVHIKDRILGGGSVPLGTGDANLPARLRALLTMGYAGDFILEAARGTPGGELAWAKRNLSVVSHLLAGSAVSVPQ